MLGLSGKLCWEDWKAWCSSTVLHSSAVSFQEQLKFRRNNLRLRRVISVSVSSCSAMVLGVLMGSGSSEGAQGTTEPLKSL